MAKGKKQMADNTNQAQPPKEAELPKDSTDTALANAAEVNVEKPKSNGMKTVTTESKTRIVPSNFVKVVRTFRGEGQNSGSLFESWHKPEIAAIFRERIGKLDSGIVSVG